MPIFGHTFGAFERPAGQSFLRFMNEIPNNGIIRLQGLMNRDWLLLTDPASLSEVLVHKAYDYEKPSFIRQFLRIVLGDGLIVVEGDEHKFQRKHASPAFSFRHIKDLYPLFWSKALEMKDCVVAESKGGNEIVEINQWANKATLDIIGVAAFGRDFHSLTTSDNELAKNYEEILEPTANKAAFFTAHLFLPRWVIARLPWNLNKALKRTTGVIKRCTAQLIQDKKALMKDQSENHVDILSILLKSNDFGDDMLGQQLLTFLAAGYVSPSHIIIPGQARLTFPSQPRNHILSIHLGNVSPRLSPHHPSPPTRRNPLQNPLPIIRPRSDIRPRQHTRIPPTPQRRLSRDSPPIPHRPRLPTCRQQRHLYRETFRTQRHQRIRRALGHQPRRKILGS